MLDNDPLAKTDLLGLDDWHHDLSQVLRKWFESKGLDIDKCGFGAILESAEHSALHSAGWNDEWLKLYLKEYLLGQEVTQDTILNHLETLKKDPRFEKILNQAKTPTAPYRKCASNCSPLERKSVQNLIDRVKGEGPQILEYVPGQSLKSFKGLGSVGKAGLKVIVPLTIYMSWCDCQAAGLSTAETTLYIAVDQTVGQIVPLPPAQQMLDWPTPPDPRFPVPWELFNLLR